MDTSSLCLWSTHLLISRMSLRVFSHTHLEASTGCIHPSLQTSSNLSTTVNPSIVPLSKAHIKWALNILNGSGPSLLILLERTLIHLFFRLGTLVHIQQGFFSKHNIPHGITIINITDSMLRFRLSEIGNSQTHSEPKFLLYLPYASG